ncbi:MAG: DUF2062 domain-containing protein [Phycisphaerae bacterium]
MWLDRWVRKQKEIRKSLINTYLHRIWGQRLFADVLWKINRRSIAGGLSLGLFVAFTPSIPFQMIIAAFGAIYFKVNLPIALAACWVTNPLTAVPIYTAAWKFGRYIVENIMPVKEALEVYQIEGKTTMIIRQGIYLWTGCLFFSVTSALSGNLLVRIFWSLGRKIKRMRHSNIPESKNKNKG